MWHSIFSCHTSVDEHVITYHHEYTPVLFILCSSSCILSNSRLVNMMCFCLMQHESCLTNNTFHICIHVLSYRDSFTSLSILPTSQCFCSCCRPSHFCVFLFSKLVSLIAPNFASLHFYLYVIFPKSVSFYSVIYWYVNPTYPNTFTLMHAPFLF